MTSVRLQPASVRGRVRAPPSKSYTHRFLLAAHLGGRTSRVRRPLLSDDTLCTARALRGLGSMVDIGPEVWTVSPPTSHRGGRRRTIDCGESGTTLRLLTAAAALQPSTYRFVGSGRLPYRPMAPLLGALQTLGATIRPHEGSAVLPLEVRGPIHGGTVRLPVDESSQFTSALLFALPRVRPDSSLRTVGAPVSEPYVRASLAVLRRHGVRISSTRGGYRIPGGQRFGGAAFSVPGDASSAAYLWAAAAVAGGTVTVDGVPSDWPQADLAVLGLLRRFGARVVRRGSSVTVRAEERCPFRVNLTPSPDLYPLAGVLAAVAPGRSELLGAAHVAAKESDRKAETARLVRAIGARVHSRKDRLTVEGTSSPRSLQLDGLRDHRLVMSAAVGALAAPSPSRVSDASAVAKSFPGFFGALESLGVEVTAT